MTEQTKQIIMSSGEVVLVDRQRDLHSGANCNRRGVRSWR
jgi:hypothetical protein